MTKQENRAKVLKGLCDVVEYFDGKVKGVMFEEWLLESRKAIAILKAQEPVKPVRHGAMWYCGNCDSKLVKPHYDAASYCWKCGKAVDWSGRTAQD